MKFPAFDKVEFCVLAIFGVCGLASGLMQGLQGLVLLGGIGVLVGLIGLFVHLVFYLAGNN